MFKYLKSFFVSKPIDSNVPAKIVKEPIKNIVYELDVKWYNNFIGYSNKLIKKELIEEPTEFNNFIDEFMILYTKLTPQFRLIDYLYRTKTAMFSDQFAGGHFHIDSLVIRKGVIDKFGGIQYNIPLCKVNYDISIEIDSENNWEII